MGVTNYLLTGMILQVWNAMKCLLFCIGDTKKSHGKHVAAYGDSPYAASKAHLHGILSWASQHKSQPQQMTKNAKSTQSQADKIV